MTDDTPKEQMSIFDFLALWTGVGLVIGIGLSVLSHLVR